MPEHPSYEYKITNISSDPDSFVKQIDAYRKETSHDAHPTGILGEDLLQKQRKPSKLAKMSDELPHDTIAEVARPLPKKEKHILNKIQRSLVQLAKKDPTRFKEWLQTCLSKIPHVAELLSTALSLTIICYADDIIVIHYFC